MAAKGHDRSREWCRKEGSPITKGHAEGINTEGGYLVPEEFENVLITLRETFGVFRRNARVWPMSHDTLRLPRRKSGLTAYAIGEATAGTESTQKFEQISLVAQKFMVLTTVSNELNEDAMVNIGDDVANEIAQAFAQKEDECGFIGDGGDTYSGIIGVRQALLDVSGTLSSIKGIVDTSETAWSGVTITDFTDVMARLPAYADTAATKWYCSKAFYHQVMEKEAYKAGGVTYREVKEKGTPTFMGYPVEFTQVLDRVSTDSSIPLLFGDLSLAAYFGDRRQMTVAFSDSALNAFEQDEVAIRGTARYDIKVPNVGDTTDAGPIIGLYI
jgi:HK97 family phage major capsid protein